MFVPPSPTQFEDLHAMHAHYGFPAKVAELNNDQLATYLQFRYDFLKEEMKELGDGIENKNPEEVVDALIDLIVVAVGTLDTFEVNGQKAWDEVHRANMSKEVGVKESRPNPLGLPDLIKPEGWVAPSHVGNYGLLTEFMK